MRLHDGALDDAGGIADAEEEGVRAAADGDARGIVGIERDVGDEVVAGDGGRADATHALVALRVFAALRLVGTDAAELAAGKVAEDAADLGGGGQRQELADIGRCGVGEKLGRNDADRGANIAERGVDARAGERAVGRVADIVVFADDEGVERHRLFAGGISSSGGTGLGRGGHRGRGGIADERQGDKRSGEERARRIQAGNTGGFHGRAGVYGLPPLCKRSVPEMKNYPRLRQRLA
ncbi:MAG: hypothetical protein V4773_23090 [Verrucomicrobiota bacterium]